MDLRKTGVLVFVLCLSVVRSALALERGNVLFHLPFEGSLAPAASQGKPQIKLTDFDLSFEGSFKTVADAAKKDQKLDEKTENGMDFVPGRKGQGLKVTENLGRSKVYSYPCVQYSTKESFSRREGTISVWIKPVGWARDARNHRYFIAVTSDNCVIRFYLYSTGTAAWVDGLDNYILVGMKEWGGWADGKWTFLTFTFKPGQQCFYVNGQLLTTVTDGLIEPEFSKTGIVEISEGSQVVDELMIFDRVLTGAEIEALYKANLP